MAGVGWAGLAGAGWGVDLGGVYSKQECIPNQWEIKNSGLLEGSDRVVFLTFHRFLYNFCDVQILCFAKSIGHTAIFKPSMHRMQGTAASGSTRTTYKGF